MVYFYFSVLFFFLIFSFLLCILILAQESKSLGMGSSFGGDAAGSLLGGSSADILKKITTWGAVFFLTLSIIISVWTSNLNPNQASNEPVSTVHAEETE
jgi:preprotein translocase subunit SecG